MSCHVLHVVEKEKPQESRHNFMHEIVYPISREWRVTLTIEKMAGFAALERDRALLLVRL